MLPHRAFAIAVAAELLYIAGRTLIRPAMSGPIAGELAVSLWRLVFVLLYLWLYRGVLRDSRAFGLRMPWHPVLLGAIALLFAMIPLAGHGAPFDLETRIVYTLTIPILALREELFVVMLGVWCALLAALAWWSLDRSRERMGL